MFNLINSYEREILDYISSVGIRTENTKANIETYKVLITVTYDLLKTCETEKIYLDFLNFIDCVANNILEVPIYNKEYHKEPKKEKLKKFYYKLQELHSKF